MEQQRTQTPCPRCGPAHPLALKAQDRMVKWLVCLSCGGEWYRTPKDCWTCLYRVSDNRKDAWPGR